jgi:hypothetical protein
MPEITQRVAVDIAGEGERIRRLVVEADRLVRLAQIQIRRREARELRAPRRVGISEELTDSPRLTCLWFAAQSLEQALEQLLEAYSASGTMTDEPPF